jgi:hypothetical protein
MILSIDGLQPEKGHEMLDVVRALERTRVWCAEALLSSAAVEVQPRLAQARRWAARLGKPVRRWRSDQPEAFGQGIAAECPGGPQRYGAKHVWRDGAQPVHEADSHAKVQRRRTGRGWRPIAREVGVTPQTPAQPARPEGQSEATPSAVLRADAAPQAVGLEYCAAVRGLWHAAQGGPLPPPGLRRAEAVAAGPASRQRPREAQKGGQRTSGSHGAQPTGREV